jgi:pSer/pThr/pTyr-binding forkhead associated (FHA) protein
MQSEQGHQVDEWQIEDLNSTNGTFVNGFDVRGETVIREGDVIRIGRIEMKLQKKSESPNAAAASASA